MTAPTPVIGFGQNTPHFGATAVARVWPLSVLARGLSIAGPAGLRAWLFALLLVPAAQRRPLPLWMIWLLAHGQRLMARGLGLRQPASPRDWTLALLLKQRPPIWLKPMGLLAWVCEPWLRPLGRMLRRGGHLLDCIDYEGAGKRLQGWASSVDSHGPLRIVLMVSSVLLALLAMTTPLDLQRQLLLLLLLWASAMLLRRVPGEMPTLILVGISLIATGRYIWWRVTSTLDLDTPLDVVLGYGLLLAEMYTWLVMVLGYLQNAWPLKRQPQMMPADSANWPTVDIYIPTYNEPLKVVKPTVLAAANLDWPVDKLKVYLLDDGRRPEFREFAAAAGVEYLIRPDNNHAKAGNLNHALKRTDGQYIAIFDCDHLPTRSFLQMTMGWFLRDSRCAMLQTPHHFYSPDPFERNLDTFRQVPNEGSLFYGLVQDGNDLWNATFFCGSCAVLRRTAIEEVGGIAIETVTEDAHTALKMHRRGWNTAYLNLPQAAGLATESLSAHVGQRIRWARGMAQIFRIDNPLIGKGLGLFQRLCYANAMLHFFYGLPRLVFLTAPLGFLFFHAHIIVAAAPVLVAYALPHLVQAGLANSRIQGQHRHSFWAEAYETVLAWYIARPTTVALIAPRIGKFNVTVKGGLVERSYFDWQIALPFMVLALLNLGGLVAGLFRLVWGDSTEIGTVLINITWTIYNVLMVGTALGVCAEARQVRMAPRIRMQLPATVTLADGRVFVCETNDYSLTGLGLTFDPEQPVQIGERLTIRLFNGPHAYDFPVQVSSRSGARLGTQFESLTLDQERALIACTFNRADAWLQWLPPDSIDHPVSSLREIVRYGVHGFLHFTKTFARGSMGYLRKRIRPEAATVGGS